MLSCWKAEKTAGGYAMISPRVAAERRKWRLIRGGGGGGFATRIRSNVPTPGATRITVPGKELLHGLGLRPCRPGRGHSRCLQGFLWCWSRRPRKRSAGRLASVPADVDGQTIAGAVSPAGVPECMDSIELPMIAGTTLPTDVAEQVADDAASGLDAIPGRL